MKDGGQQFDVMSRKEIEVIRNKSRAGKSGPWVTHWEEMAKKTILRRGVKLVPMTAQDQRVLVGDELTDAGQPQDAAMDFDVDLDTNGQGAIAATATVVEPPAIQAAPVSQPSGKVAYKGVNPDTIKNLGDLYNACLEFGMKKADVLAPLKVKSETEIADPREAYVTIAVSKGVEF